MEKQVFLGLWILLLFIMLTCQHPMVSVDLQCDSGHILYTPSSGPDVCLPCPPGQFMPHNWHTHRLCYDCSKIQDPRLEVLVSPYNETHDIVIHCIDGYYRTRTSYINASGTCQKCTDCPFPKLSGQKFKDTFCCPGDNYGVYLNQRLIPDCVMECGRGQYLDAATGYCYDCPENTYMDEDKHIHMNYCKRCETAQSPHEKVLRMCNRTHPAIIGCEYGFYRRRKFDNSKRAEHSECVRLCGRGQFSDTDQGICLTCPVHTYMDEDEQNHTGTCKSCYFPGSPNEIIVQPCNSIHQTVIGCHNGYYRRQQLHTELKDVCAPCKNCSVDEDGNSYEGRSCEQSHDTVCCPQPCMTVVDALGGPKCVVPTYRTKVCGEGEYLSSSDRTHEVTCRPCALGTYMDETEHTRNSCRSCEEFPHKKYCPPNKPGPLPVDGDALTLGQVFGLALGTTAFYLLLALGIYAWWRRRKRKAGKEHRPENKPMLEFPEEGGSSDRRPEFYDSTNKPYPYSGPKPRTTSHKGNEWVEDVKMYTNQLCPCVTCQQSSHSLTSWGEVVICTAASVVFGITEGRN